ncbi:MAG: ABC transporter permease subunit [Spirochaetaceae bacterium]|nr:ABC transporter permease subunit [Spirochaetaceae bacterium]
MYIVVSILSLLIIWQIASYLLDSEILLPDVKTVFKDLLGLLFMKSFSLDILFTVYRAFKSFVIIVIAASILGIMGGRLKPIGYYLSPFLTVLKATPVMSVILLAFIWFKTGNVPVFSAFLMAFPIMYIQMENGFNNLEEEMNQMCSIYNFSKKDKLTHYLIPYLSKSFVLGAKQALSMIWKVVIAAEVLTVPNYGVGAKMQLSQMQLNTSSVLAWTLVAIILTSLSDLLFFTISKIITKLINSRKEKVAL